MDHNNNIIIILGFVVCLHEQDTCIYNDMVECIIRYIVCNHLAKEHNNNQLWDEYRSCMTDKHYYYPVINY